MLLNIILLPTQVPAPTPWYLSLFSTIPLVRAFRNACQHYENIFIITGRLCQERQWDGGSSFKVIIQFSTPWFGTLIEDFNLITESFSSTFWPVRHTHTHSLSILIIYLKTPIKTVQGHVKKSFFNLKNDFLIQQSNPAIPCV